MSHVPGKPGSLHSFSAAFWELGKRKRLMKGCQLWFHGALGRKSKEGKRWVKERGDKRGRKKGGEEEREEIVRKRKEGKSRKRRRVS